MTDKEKAKMAVECEKQFKLGYLKAAIDFNQPISVVSGNLKTPVSTLRAWKKKLENMAAE